MQQLIGSILIVDDTTIVRKTLSFALKKAGHEVTEASNGSEALALLYNQEVDLIFLDIHMPVMDGFEVLQALKQDPHFSNIPVIVLSANEEIEYAVRCIELGAIDYINKPFNATLLNARVQSTLEKKRLRDKEIAHQKELEKLYIELKKMDKAKDDFVAMVAHELRNPIHGMMAAHEILSRLYSEEKSSGVFNSMYFALDNLQTLVEDLNDISQIESGSINLEFSKVSIPPLLDRVVSSLEHKIGIKNHQLTINMPESIRPIFGDRFRIGQIFTNLISNAIKYTPENGHIHIEIAPFQHDSEQIQVTIRDNGIGIDKSALKNIFDKYYRVHDDTLSAEGIGLGMFITKTLIQKHNGQVWIESQPKKGTAVHFTLHLAANDEWSISQNNDTFSPNLALN